MGTFAWSPQCKWFQVFSVIVETSNPPPTLFLSWRDDGYVAELDDLRINYFQLFVIVSALAWQRNGSKFSFSSVREATLNLRSSKIVSRSNINNLLRDICGCFEVFKTGKSDSIFVYFVLHTQINLVSASSTIPFDE